MLIVVPLGLLGAAVLFDLLYLLTGDETFASVAYWDIALGLVGGLAAAIFGLVDWAAIRSEVRAKRVGMVHGLGNVLVLLLFGWSWWLRQPEQAYAPDLLPFILGLLAVLLALVTAWLGGELVYRLRIGVDRDAHPDASSSLGQGIVSVGREDRAGSEAQVDPRPS
jgi:uncharacterized membrane protein